MEMENRLRGTVSEARFDKIKVNPNLDDTLFTLSALEMERAIPMASPDPGA